MITAVDSNILIDIFSEDRVNNLPAEEALNACLMQGMVVASGIVIAETMPHFPSVDIFFEALSVLKVQPQIISMPAFVEAASAWKAYKRAGGSRNRLMADFLIGAHALVECDCLLTRDRGFYRQYFKKLKIIEPKI